MRSITILGCNRYSQITVAHVTLPTAVLSTVKMFAVYKFHTFLKVFEDHFLSFQTKMCIIKILDTLESMWSWERIKSHTECSYDWSDICKDYEIWMEMYKENN